MKSKKPAILILHNIRSSLNAGSIFRTADAVGVRKIYLTGYTPAPLDRFGRPNKRLLKASLGAEKSVPWERHKNIFDLLSKLKKSGFCIVALEQDDSAINYRKFKSNKPAALICGNEIAGIEKEVLSKSNFIVEIPMVGKKESLNVAVAAGIVLFSIIS